MSQMKRFARLATTAAAFTIIGGLSASPADAASCGFLGLLCPAPAPTTTPISTTPVTTPPVSTPPVTVPPLLPAPAPAPAPATPGNIAEVPELNVRLLQLVNQERAAAGLAPLMSRPEIADWSVRHSMAMADRRDIWHNDAYFASSTRKALGAVALGENVAMNGSLEDAHRRLMESPGHRANILNGRFDLAGIGVVHDEDGGLYITQSFVDSAAQKAVKPKAKAKKVTKKVAKKATKKVAKKAKTKR